MLYIVLQQQLPVADKGRVLFRLAYDFTISQKEQFAVTFNCSFLYKGLVSKKKELFYEECFNKLFLI